MTESGLVRDSSRAWLRQGVDDSLRALGVDYIDLYQVHWPDPNVARAETAGMLEDWSKQARSGTSASRTSTSRRWQSSRTLGRWKRSSRRTACFVAISRPHLAVHPHTRHRRLVYGPLAHGLLSGGMDEGTTFAADDGEAPTRRSTARHFTTISEVRDLRRFASQELGSSVAQLAVAWTLANPAVQVAIVGADERSTSTMRSPPPN